MSERAGAKAGGSNLFASARILRVRCGERHPGLREDPTLRGVVSERGSWSARRHVVVPPLRAARRRQRMSFGRRGGERRLARATNARAPGAGTTNRASAQETRPSLGPKTRARQSSLCIRRKLDGGALIATSRLGKLAQAGGTNTGVVVSGRSAARRVSIAPAREAAWHVRKGRRSRPPSLRGSRARVWLLARRCMLQKSAGDVWSRISSANALQKERQGRVNRDLALRGRRWVKPAAGSESEKTLA